MSGNALVVAEESSTTWSTALGPVESFAQSAQAMGEGDWVEAGLTGVVGGLETLGAIADPAGALLSAGVGWLMEHFEPLPTLLDELAGNPDQIHAFASTWHNVAGRIHENADSLRAEAARVGSDWEGPAVTAYQAAVDLQAQMIDGFGTMTTGVALTTETAGVIVAGVRALVRDAISQLVGYGLSKLAQLLSPMMPKALFEIAGKVMEWIGRISSFVSKLLSSMGKLGAKLNDVLAKLDDAGAKITEIAAKYDGLPINQGDYDFAPIFAGNATRASYPTTPYVLFNAGTEAGKGATDVDDR